MFSLVWNEADPTSDTAPEKLHKAHYATKKQAIDQAEHDVSLGKRVVGVADKDGNFVWTADDHSDKKKLVINSGAAEYPLSLET